MNAHSPPDSATQIGRHLLREFCNAAERDPVIAVAAADLALEWLAPRFPEAAPVFGEITRDCEFWAELAPDTAVVAMFAACLKRLERHPIPGATARKRAIVALWNSFDPKERAAFLEAVDPGSKGAAA